ncbi:MAG: hypothetical protein EOP54_08140 [Sphingobacteriales bacterium]|nr:MAG: hypothetical protein EOP54_08140 [Sphingobacteriales bacterium]
MAGKSRFFIAASRIKKYFQNSRKRVFSAHQIDEILNENRQDWNLPQSMNLDKFIEKGLESNLFNEVVLNFVGSLDKRKLYAVDEASVLEIALGVRTKTYLSYFTAVYLNGLTNQLPKTVYLSFEQSVRYQFEIDNNLTQESIDSAFAKPQRRSNTFAIYNDYTILLHSSKFTDRLGIYTSPGTGLTITNIERTLIDITVRPDYSGGVSTVLEAYRNAKERVSINKLISYLKAMKFIYPYWQVVGFYLEHAGYDKSKLDVFYDNISEFRFYLAYQMNAVKYDLYWKVYYPAGLI